MTEEALIGNKEQKCERYYAHVESPEKSTQIYKTGSVVRIILNATEVFCEEQPLVKVVAVDSKRFIGVLEEQPFWNPVHGLNKGDEISVEIEEYSEEEMQDDEVHDLSDYL